MAKIKPFKAVRPKKEFVKEVATLPYDVFSEKEAREIVDANPNSFLKVVRSETAFPIGTDPYSKEVYEKAKNLEPPDKAEGFDELIVIKGDL